MNETNKLTSPRFPISFEHVKTLKITVFKSFVRKKADGIRMEKVFFSDKRVSLATLVFEFPLNKRLWFSRFNFIH